MEDVFLIAEVLTFSLERASFLISPGNQEVSISETLIALIMAWFSMIKDCKVDHLPTTSLCQHWKELFNPSQSD